MRKHLRYLRYVIRHKLFVYQEGRKLGVGRLQLLIHDWSKFLPDEWLPYTEYFYGGRQIPADMRAAYFLHGKVQQDFDLAWLKHQHRNPHHWQHHLLPLDDGGARALEMPDKHRREMVADWTAMGRAFGEPDAPRGWYEKNRENMKLHPKTRAWVEAQLAKAGR